MEIRGLLIAVLVGALSTIIAAKVGPYTNGIAVDVRNTVNIGQYQPVLGDLFTAVVVSVVAAIPLGLMIRAKIWLYAVVAAMVYPSVMAYLALWPSNREVQVTGWLVFIVVFVLSSWCTNRALTRALQSDA